MREINKWPYVPPGASLIIRSSQNGKHGFLPSLRSKTCSSLVHQFSASSGHHLYIYMVGMMMNCISSVIDTRNLELSSNGGPRKKEGCRMVCYGQKILLFGPLGEDVL